MYICVCIYYQKYYDRVMAFRTVLEPTSMMIHCETPPYRVSRIIFCDSNFLSAHNFPFYGKFIITLNRKLVYKMTTDIFI